MSEPEKERTRKIVALVRDLMFSVKVQHAAKQTGAAVTFVRSREELLQQARTAPALVILDLNDSSIDAPETIAELKSDPVTRSVKLLGYVSHVQTDTIKAARENGCDYVLPRSAFAQKLPEILQQSFG